MIEQSAGVPLDSANCELCDWIYFSRISAPNHDVAIKGDQVTSYPVIKTVMDYLQDDKIGKANKFKLVTNMEKGAE
jgi:hypothetical protein